MLQMIQIVLPGMANRKRGLIINMSSGVAKFPFPEFSLYGSTKSFVEYFSKTLSYEYKSKGITVQVSKKSNIDLFFFYFLSLLKKMLIHL